MDLQSVTVWVNAFIPNSACIQKGEVFAVEVPTFITGLPIPEVRFFMGDQREFSDDVQASARMHSEVRIEGLSTETPQLAAERQVCGESHEVDADGTIVASETADTRRMAFMNLRGSQTTDPEGGVVDGIEGSVQVDVVGSASLPLIIAPDIDYSGTFTIDRVGGNVLFRGAVSGFPAYEIYCSVNDGPPLTLGLVSPISPLDLFGEEDRPVAFSVRIVM